MKRRSLALAALALASAAIPAVASGPRGGGAGIRIVDAALGPDADTVDVQMRWNGPAARKAGRGAGTIAVASWDADVPLDMRIDGYRINDKGLEERYYTVQLAKAIVVEANAWFPDAFVATTQKHGPRNGLYTSAWYDYRVPRATGGSRSEATRSDVCGAVRIGRGVDLSGCFAVAADLASLDLTGAILAATSLQHADLSGADLSGANLTGANLTGANLAGADLSGAVFCGTVMPDGSLGNENC